VKFFIDTANVEEIREAASLGVLDGVTTNPSLIAKEGRDFFSVLREIVSLVDGPISAEVTATDRDGMVEEGRELSKIHPNIVIKVPLIKEGLQACKILRGEGIGVNVTLCFSPSQALLAASIRHPLHVVEAALAGADVATIPFKVVEQLLKHPLTDRGQETFLADWKKLNKRKK